MKIFVLAVLVVLVIVFGPFITIWALNTLFPALNIPYNFPSWFAVLWLTGMVRGSYKTE